MSLPSYQQDIFAATVLLDCLASQPLQERNHASVLVRRVISDAGFRYHLWLAVAERTHPFYGGDRHVFAAAREAKHRLDLQQSLRAPGGTGRRSRTRMSGAMTMTSA